MTQNPTTNISSKQTLTITGIVLVLLAVFLYPYIHTIYTAKTIKQETAQTDILIKSIDQTTDQLPEVFTQTKDETERRITNAHNTIQEETRTQTPQLVVSNLNRELDLFLAEHTRRSVDIRP